LACGARGRPRQQEHEEQWEHREIWVPWTAELLQSRRVLEEREGHRDRDEDRYSASSQRHPQDRGDRRRVDHRGGDVERRRAGTRELVRQREEVEQRGP